MSLSLLFGNNSYLSDPKGPFLQSSDPAVFPQLPLLNSNFKAVFPYLTLSVIS